MAVQRIKLILILFFIPYCIIAQEEWSLEKCISYALENNIQIKQQELNAQYSENNLLQSKLNILPTLNGYAMYQSNFGTTVDPFTSSFTPNNVQSGNVSLSSTMTLFNGFQKYNTIKQSKFDLLASIQDVEKMKNDISLNIASAYLQILFNLELAEIAKNQIAITEQQVDRTRKMVNAGSLAKGSLLEVEAQEASEELQYVNAKNQLDISYLNLIQLLDLDSTQSISFEIEKPLLPEIKEQELHISIEDIYMDAVDTLPQIKSAEYKLKSAEKGLAIAQGSRSPRLSANATWWASGYSSALGMPDLTTLSMDTMISGFTSSGEDVYAYDYNYDTKPVSLTDQFSDNKSTSFSVSLSIPIFNNWQVSNAVSNAKINLLNQQYQLESTRNMLLKEIQQAHADAVAALKKFQASRKALSSIEEAFHYTQEKFNVGLVSSVDYNLSKSQLTKARSDLLQAKYEYIFKTKILDFYMG
ncbi:MAG: hypothetical protein C0594_15800, partial [Marinilabiliales bacterium]